MMSEELQDRAIQYALDLLSEAEVLAFRAAMAGDEELRNFVLSVENHVAGLAYVSTLVSPPPALLPKIMADLRSQQDGAEQKIVAPSGLQAQAEVAGHGAWWLPWAVAACLALACGLLASNLVQLRGQLESVRGQLNAAERHDELSQMKIATLTSKVEEYAKVAAVVIWDVRNQQGVVELSKLPPLDPSQDYQMWVIDPAQAKPVSGGVVTVERDGTARVVFHPVISTPTASNFAISVEAKGGVPEGRGPIVLAGQ